MIYGCRLLRRRHRQDHQPESGGRSSRRQRHDLCQHRADEHHRRRGRRYSDIRTGEPNDGFDDTLDGGLGNDTLTVGGGNDTVDGGVGGDDLLVINYSADCIAFLMNGPAIITDFTNTSVSFSNIERFNATFGSGNDVIVLLGGNDVINGGGGNDSLNTAAGAAVVDGGIGDDLWIADFSSDASVKNINLNLAGIQAAGNGTTYVNIERMNINGGAGNDILTSRTGNTNDGFIDTLNGGLGNDTLTVGGGLTLSTAESAAMICWSLTIRPTPSHSS